MYFSPVTIIIVAYETEVCNPLGSAAKKSKLGCVFFSLGNIRPALRSTLKSIFLVAVADVPTVQKHEILRPFVNDIKDLSTSGLVLKNKQTFSVALVAFLSDNLAAHASMFLQEEYAEVV